MRHTGKNRCGVLLKNTMAEQMLNKKEFNVVFIS